jgi:hypothetical protein
MLSIKAQMMSKVGGYKLDWITNLICLVCFRHAILFPLKELGPDRGASLPAAARIAVGGLMTIELNLHQQSFLLKAGAKRFHGRPLPTLTGLPADWLLDREMQP